MAVPLASGPASVESMVPFEPSQLQSTEEIEGGRASAFTACRVAQASSSSSSKVSPSPFGTSPCPLAAWVVVPATAMTLLPFVAAGVLFDDRAATGVVGS